MIYLAVFISVLLFIATVFISFQIKQNPTSERINNKKRLIAWWMIFALCILVFLCASLFGPFAILLFINALLLWVLYELFILLQIDINSKKVLLLLFVLVIFSAIVFWYPQRSEMFLIIAIVAAHVVYFTPVTSSSYVVTFSIYCSFSIYSVAITAILSSQKQLDYSHLLLILFFMIAVNDIAQYVTGKQFGKTLIAPKMSPGKTVAGVWGGILMTSLLSILLMPSVLNVSTIEAFAIGSVLSLAGFCGDLIVSKLKRGLKIKDSGNSIMGHGGILDRVDSLLLAAPVFGLLLILGSHL